MKKLLFTLVVLVSTFSFAQTVRFEGIIQDDKKAPLEMANVMAMNQATKAMDAYAITNDKGKFLLNLKTNTTYLSYVVNKRFGKSFGEYSNELKINYVINEMITNHMYRKYSTQAIAESVGFKNAVSFAKSFRKRTGVSPAQFASNI